MASIVLDSFPTGTINIPETVEINKTPYYGRRTRGRPMLGAQQVRPRYFVPVGDSSPRIKKLLELPENNTAPKKPLVGYTEIMKKEKKKKSNKPMVSKKVFNAKFKEEAREYLNTPNHNRNNSYITSKRSTPIRTKNSAVNIAAAAQPVKSKPKPKLSKPGIVTLNKASLKKKEDTLKSRS